MHTAGYSVIHIKGLLRRFCITLRSSWWTHKSPQPSSKNTGSLHFLHPCCNQQTFPGPVCNAGFLSHIRSHPAHAHNPDDIATRRAPPNQRSSPLNGLEKSLESQKKDQIFFFFFSLLLFAFVIEYFRIIYQVVPLINISFKAHRCVIHTPPKVETS